jgi:CHAT domain-containing protein
VGRRGGRSAAQLAARLASGEAAGEARTFQDAERAYRAALARRQRLSALGDAGEALTAAADRQVDEASRALAAAETALRSRSPRFLELVSPRIAAGDLQSVLGEEEGYLRIVLGGAGAYGALVTRTGVQPYRIGLTEAQAEALAAKLRRSTQLRGARLPDYDVDAAHQLHRALIAPVAEPVATLKRLSIDAGGPLAAVPFAALVEAPPDAATTRRIDEGQDYSGVQWLARRIAVSSAVGPASFISLRRLSDGPGALKVAAFGDFQPAPRAVAERLAKLRNLTPRCAEDVQKALARLPALPETEDEARRAAGLFGAAGSAQVGERFSDKAFFESEEVSDATVLLLATHGVLGLSSCFPEPALLTSLGEAGDGLIEASELLDRRLSARLVILSACDTAGGARLDAARTGLSDGGEALSGLARGFLYAGASSVLATQWKIDAASSSAQVRELLAAARTGETPLADALAATQRTMYGSAETAHPSTGRGSPSSATAGSA